MPTQHCIIKNLTDKIILLSDMDGVSPLEPKEERDLLLQTSPKNIQESRILKQLLKQKYIVQIKQPIETAELEDDQPEPTSDEIEDMIQTIKHISDQRAEGAKNGEIEDEGDEAEEDEELDTDTEEDEENASLFDSNGKLTIDVIPDELVSIVEETAENCQKNKDTIEKLPQPHTPPCQGLSDLMRYIQQGEESSIKKISVDYKQPTEEPKAISNMSRMSFEFKDLNMSRFKELTNFLNLVREHTGMDVRDLELKFRIG